MGGPGAHAVHGLSAVGGALHHGLAMAIGHLRMGGHPNALQARPAGARSDLRDLTPLVMSGAALLVIIGIFVLILVWAKSQTRVRPEPRIVLSSTAAEVER